MKQDRLCGWCNDTDEIEPMQQGGKVHMLCSGCGSKAGIVEFEELRIGYIRLMQENKVLKERLAAAITEKSNKKLVIPAAPRYDDVYNQGVAWLDTL